MDERHDRPQSCSLSFGTPPIPDQSNINVTSLMISTKRTREQESIGRKFAVSDYQKTNKREYSTVREVYAVTLCASSRFQHSHRSILNDQNDPTSRLTYPDHHTCNDSLRARWSSSSSVKEPQPGATRLCIVSVCYMINISNKPNSLFVIGTATGLERNSKTHKRSWR